MYAHVCREPLKNYSKWRVMSCLSVKQKLSESGTNFSKNKDFVTDGHYPALRMDKWAWAWAYTPHRGKNSKSFISLYTSEPHYCCRFKTIFTVYFLILWRYWCCYYSCPHCLLQGSLLALPPRGSALCARWLRVCMYVYMYVYVCTVYYFFN
jgi:hypothetical protein